MQTPTVGRRVWFWPQDIERTIFPSDQPFDAGVAHVNGDGTINCSIVNEFGNSMNGKQGVLLLPYSERRPGVCTWMPYQEKVALVQTPSLSPPGPVQMLGGEEIAAGIAPT